MKKLPLFLLFSALAASAPADALPRPNAASFDKGAPFTVAGYAGSAPLSGFPVLVRIAANSPAGFYYTDLHSQSDGADIAFVDMDGNGLPFEIDTWNPSGTSLIWVRLPAMTNGTQFVMCWGSAASGKTVCADSPFADYVGVWHMSEASGTVADSSGNGFAATPSGVAAATASVAVAGVVGNGRQCSTATGASKLSYLSVPSYDSKAVGNTFAVSGWVSIGSGQTGSDNDARLFSRKENYQNAHGWEVMWKTGKQLNVRGASSGNTVQATNLDYAGKGWKHIFVVYDDTSAAFYENGVLKKSGTGVAPTENGRPLAIGGYANDNGSQLVGSVDECRLLDAVPTADWAKAEYDSMTDAAFLTAGEAELYGASSVPVAGILVSSVGYTNATVVVAISDFGTGATSADGALEVSATADFAAPILAETYSAAAAGSRSFLVSGLSTNATYFVRGFVTNDLHAATAVPPVSFTTLAPAAPAGTVSLQDRGVSSISATAAVVSSGSDSSSASIRLEASADAFATTVPSAWEDVPAGASRVLTVSGLAPLTAYDVRLRLRNEWGIETVSGLGRIVTLPASGLEELYVDSLGNGNGTSPASALPTIREAVELAAPGFTIWVRGGEGRAYNIANETDTLPIPASLEGLSIRGYADLPGDGGRALVTISDDYIVDGNRAHVISNRAANVTVSGLDFAFGTTAIGKQNFGSCSILWTAAPFTTMENCLLRMTQPTTYAGSGASSPLVICASRDATNLVVRGCEFRNTRCWSANHGYPLIKCKSNALIAGNVFTNVNSTATAEQRDAVNGGEQPCYNFTFVSNVVYGANDGGNLSSGLLYGLYPGPKSAEIAFNRFVADPDARAQNGGVIPHRVNMTFGAQFADAFSGKEATLVHHNTIIGGQSAFLFNDAQKNKRKTQFFSNLILLDPGSTNLVENVASGTTAFDGGRTTSFIEPSCLRNNAYTGVLTGGTATQVSNYDIEAGLYIADNVQLTVRPDFLCTNDIYSADFYRYRSGRAAGDLGRLGWPGPDGTQPRYVGAVPPKYPDQTLMVLR